MLALCIASIARAVRLAAPLAALALFTRAPPPSDAEEQKERAREQVTHQDSSANERQRLRAQRASGAANLVPPANEERPGDRPPEDRSGQRVGEEHAQPADHNGEQAPARAQQGPRVITQKRVAPPRPVQMRPRMQPVKAQAPAPAPAGDAPHESGSAHP